MIVILLGPPGSGKGTQVDQTCQKYNLLPVATGNILRNLIATNNICEKSLAKMMGTGELFPDEIVNNLVVEAINNNVCNADYTYKNNYKGLLFDGYPRTVGQAAFLENILNKINKKVDCVLVFNIPHSMIVERITARRVDKTTGKVYNLISMPPPPEVIDNLIQRIDDTEEVIKNRLNIYKKQTEPLIEYYSKSNLIKNVDASKEFEITEKNISLALQEFV